MIKSLKKLFLFVFVFLISISSLISFSFADDDGYSYKTDSFVTTIKVNEDYTFDVKEEITVDFTSPKHGIFRVIPTRVGRSVIKNIKVEGGPVHKSTESASSKVDLLILKIGDKDRFLEGKNKYTISYKIKGYSVKDSADVLRLNLIPTNWQTPIKHAKTTLIMPKAFDFSDGKIYFGSVNQRTNIRIGDAKNFIEGNQSFRISSSPTELTLIVDNLGAKEGATFVQKVSEGFWKKPATYDSSYKRLFFFNVLLTLIILALYLRYKPHKRIVKTVEFRAPDDITPVEMGYLLEGSIEDSHLSSTIVYMANKGYIGIEKSNDGEYVLNKIMDIPESEKNFLKVFFRALFFERDSVRMNDLDNYFYDKMIVVKDMIRAHHVGDMGVYKVPTLVFNIVISIALMVLSALHTLVFIKVEGDFKFIILLIVLLLLSAFVIIYLNILDRKKFLGKSIKGKRTIIFLLVVFLFLMVLVLGYASLYNAFSIMSFVLFMVNVFLSVKLVSRTEYNISMLGKILGFKDFIRKVEVKRLELLVNDDSKYFYDVLPYAYVFGLTDVWMKKFDSLNISSPDWYNSETGFDSFDMLSFMVYMNLSRSYFESVGNDIDMGGYDFGNYGGGNYSGGGFGGGGGGAW